MGNKVISFQWRNKKSVQKQKEKADPNLLYKIGILTFVVLIWIGSANLYVLIRYVGSGAHDIPGLSVIVNGLNMFTLASVAGGLNGLFLGSLEVFVYPSFVRRVSFGTSLLYRGVIFILTICLLVYGIGTFYGVQRNLEVGQPDFSVVDYYFSKSFIGLFLYMFITNFLVDFGLQMNKKVGPGVIPDIMMGKYYKPREEDRVFMFLDLQSSTQIAEKLGHVRFSLLLQDCFRDLSDLLMAHSASIYQFVGDEAVLTWPVRVGTENCNCLKVYYRYEELLHLKKNYYFKKYEVNPVFKASVHMGRVTVAEVGEIKSEIAYHGDVLNTAARVQALCNDFHAKILITDQLYHALPDVKRKYTISFLKETELKGKERKVKIYRVDA